MANPLERAHIVARNDHERMASMINLIGTRENPGGLVTTAYRVANRAMRGYFNRRRDQYDLAESREIMSTLRRSMMTATNESLDRGTRLGARSAEAQLRAYSLRIPRPPTPTIPTRGISVVSAEVTRLSTTVESLLVANVEKELIVGSTRRVGALSPGFMTKTLTYWSLLSMWDMWGATIGAVIPKKSPYRKQVVATMDARVTDCCLNAHGQIVKFDDMFYTPDSPAYADFQEWTPFHEHCRTSIALYLEQFDIGLTSAMLAAASVLRVIGEGPRPRTALG